MEMSNEFQSIKGFVKGKSILLIKHNVNAEEQCEG